MNATWYEKGIEKGVDRGQRQLLRELLEEQYGPLPPTAIERLEQMATPRLKALGKAMLQHRSLHELGLVD